jgi:aryl-alcohol dehydrogenase-like predicted oxidoreductase
MIPIPGFKTVDQVRENAGAMEFGPLEDTAMRQIDEILER